MFTVNDEYKKVNFINYEFQNISCLRLISLLSLLNFISIISKHFMFTVNHLLLQIPYPPRTISKHFMFTVNEPAGENYTRGADFKTFHVYG